MSERDAAQDVELHEHEDRLDDLEDRLSTAFPTPDTPVGGAQRFRFAVPTPSTVLTLGARGSAASEGQAIGPGGVAVQTAEDLAAEIQRNMILTTIGNTIVNTDGHMRLLADQDVGVSSAAHVLVGSDAGNIELTAGDAGFTDPGFTVVPSVDVPEPPEVDTRAPRETAEGVMGAWEMVWRGIKGASRLRKFLPGQSSGASLPSISPPSLSILRTVNAVVQGARAAIEIGIAAVEHALDDDDDVSASGPQVVVHGAGGVQLTTPRKVVGFGVQGVKMESPNKAEVQGGVEAALNSGVYATVYGAMCAGLKSDGVVNVSGTGIGVAGDYLELTGREAAALTSAGALLIESTSFIAMNTVQATVCGETLALTGSTRLDMRGREIVSEAQRDYRITSQAGALELDGQQRVNVRVGGDNRFRATDSLIQLGVGHSFITRIDNSSVRVGRTVEMRNGEVVLRGRVRMG